jgi:hypothetical protein
MAKFAVKYEIEVIVEAPIANWASQKVTAQFNKFDYSNFDSVTSFKKISTTEVKEEI